MSRNTRDERSSSDDLNKSLRSFSVMIASAITGLAYFIRGGWRWLGERHPVVIAFITAPVTLIAPKLLAPIAEPIYSLFWVNQVPISGSLYITGLPVPVSIAIYFLLFLLAITMFSNHRTRQEIEELRERIN